VSAVLDVAFYTMDYLTPAGRLRVLDDVNLAVEPGEVVGLVGESGSGKTTLATAIMRDLAPNAEEVHGRMRFLGRDLRAADARAVRQLRGRAISMVFQDPSTSLNPTLALGRQITEVLERHRGMTHEAASREACVLLRAVELRDAEAILRRYPHEVSGGEKQRVVIATALACRPKLILLDEPTTALDVITGTRFLETLRRLLRESGAAALYISHDLALVAQIADRVAVIERGRIVEQASATEIFTAPKHAYTQRLVAAVPRPDRRLVSDAPSSVGLLRLDEIGVSYGRPALFAARRTHAADSIAFEMGASEILGLVGESGSGKSTVARAMTGLAPFSGRIKFLGRDIHAPAQMDRAYRAGMQIVFQNPDASLNPRHRIGDILGRPLRLFGGDTNEIPRLLEEVRLPAAYASRYPHQLSGGEKQRVAIARAFAAKPRLVICDEVTAALDVSVQSTVIELLLALREKFGTAYLFITHDLNLVRQIAHRIAVMRGGRLVDLRSAADIASPDAAPYTRELIAACPTPVG
jgi:peptide/nickel transport system ATP-binding protein